MNPELRRVARAVASRRAAEHEYRAALQAARDSGASLAEIARAAGVTRSAIAQLTRPPQARS